MALSAFALLLPDEADVVVGLGQGRIDLHRRLVCGQRLVQFALLKMHGPDVDKGLHGMGVDLQASFQ